MTCAATFPLEREVIRLGTCRCTMTRCEGTDRPVVERRIETIQTLTCLRDGQHAEHMARDGKGGTYHWDDA